MLIDGKFYSDPELISYIKKLKNTIAMNEKSQKIADGVIEELKQENARLKELFKLAFRDAKYYENEYCSLCGTSECPTKCTQKEDCIFKYQDEIQKLISDE